MKQFKFPLDAVLTVRTMTCDRIQIELASARLALHHLINERELLEGQLDHLYVQKRECQWQRPIPVHDVHELTHHINQVIDSIHACTHRIDRASQEIDLLQESLLQAHKDQKVLELLHDSQKKTYYQSLMRHEQQWMDEVTIYRHSTTTRENFAKSQMGNR